MTDREGVVTTASRSADIASLREEMWGMSETLAWLTREIRDLRARRNELNRKINLLEKGSASDE